MHADYFSNILVIARDWKQDIFKIKQWKQMFVTYTYDTTIKN